MLISVKELSRIWGIKPRGVLHIGAHEAEESHWYDSYHWNPVIWIEAQSRLAKQLEHSLSKSNRVIHAAIWDVNGCIIELGITNNSQSSSLLKLGTHKDSYPDVHICDVEMVTTHRIDSLLNEKDVIEFVNLDIQGVELKALIGFGTLLSNVNVIYTEVNKKEVYQGCALFQEIELFLKDKGFALGTVRWVPGKGWGDALFLRESEYPILRRQVLLSRLSNSLFYLNFYLRYPIQSIKKTVRKILRITSRDRNIATK